MAVVMDEDAGLGGMGPVLSTQGHARVLYVPLGTSPEFPRERLPANGLESAIGAYSSVHFHVRQLPYQYVSIRIFGHLKGFVVASDEYTGPYSAPHRLPDGTIMRVRIDYRPGMSGFSYEVVFE